jgi:NitT/TauT family transport system permease protein
MNRSRRGRLAWGILPIVASLVVWEIAARSEFTPGFAFLPPFSVVGREFCRLVADGVLIDSFKSSLSRVLIGFCAGAVAGLVTGTLMGWKEAVDQALSPLISLLCPIPALGWLPLLMLWIGVSEALPIGVIFICSFFPICYNTATGIRSVDRSFVRAARVLGASDSRVLVTVLVPMAVPAIFTGLRLEAGMAWRVLIAAEMVAIPTGIGALLMRAESLIRVDIIIVCLMVLSLMCFSFERFFGCVEERLTRLWR